MQSIPFYFDYLNMSAGVATISDKKGGLLFFISMGHVATREEINGKYQQMPDGDIFRNTNIQGAFVSMIMENPQNEEKYYIFLIGYYTDSANQLINNLYVAEVDMKLNNGSGDVVPNSLRLLKENTAQGMAAMLHENEQDYWLLSSTVSGDSLLAYPVNVSGIGSPVISITNKNLDAKSWLKSSPNSEKFVTSGRHGIELFHFNRQTAADLPIGSLVLPDSAQQRSSAYAFSPNGSKLYVGTENRPGSTLYSILQYDLSAGNVQQIQQSVTEIFKSIPQTLNGIRGVNSITDMQLAINGKIYFSREDSVPQYLSEISYPDQDGVSCGFKFNGEFLGQMGGYVYCLPALNQTLFRNAGILQAQANKDTICYGDSVKLSAYGAGAERFRWQIANGLTPPNDTLANPVVFPTATTTYQVIGTSPFRTDTAFVKVVVQSNPEMKISGPTQVYTFAEDQEYRVSGEAPGSTLHWEISDGEIVSGQGTNRIRVNWGEEGSGTVRVVESNDHACNYSESLKVEVSGSLPPVFYNVITPNADNKNDAFVIENLKWLTENELIIYNRWGVEVFRSRNYKNNWQAENVCSGVYFYRFQADGKTWKGWLEVMK